VQPRTRRVLRRIRLLTAPVILLALVLLVLLDRNAVQSFDQSVGGFLSAPARNTRWVSVPLRVITFLSSPVVVGVFTLLAAVNLAGGRWLRARNSRSWFAWALEWGSARAPLWGPPVGVVLVVLGAGIVRLALAAAVTRPGPSFTHAVVESAGSAFPDPHTTLVAAVGGAMLVARGSRRRAAWTLVVLTVVLTGLAEVGLGAYGLSDALAGAALGTSAALAGRYGGLLTDGPVWRGVQRLRRGGRPTGLVVPAGVIFNPTKFGDPGGFRNRVRDSLEGRPDGAGTRYRVRFYETTPTDPGEGVARRALAEGAQLLVAAGGDGTVRSVCAGAAGSGVPVGVVASGTSNLLARNLHLPLQEGPALDAVMAGESRCLDAGTVEGDGLDPDGFVVMAGMGFDGAIMADVPRRLKKILGLSAYVVTGARHLLDEAVRMEVTVDDDEVIVRDARTVIVGNVGSVQVLNLLPGARPDDGLLNVIIVAPRRNRGLIRVFWRLVRMQATSDEEIEYRTARTVRIRAAEPVHRQLDGDAISPGREMSIGIRPGSLTIRTPNRRWGLPKPPEVADDSSLTRDAAAGTLTVGRGPEGPDEPDELGSDRAPAVPAGSAGDDRGAQRD
jgi:diacylglycerol kinase family enzyme